jgi:hypothetical protein
MASKEQVSQLLKSSHRAFRDALLNLIRAFRNRNPLNVRLFLDQVAVPYEEKAFRPARVEVLDQERINQRLVNQRRRYLDGRLTPYARLKGKCG